MAPALNKVFELLADLIDAHVEEAPALGPGEGNFRCTDCEGCYDCRFCVGCRACEQCTYCEGCEGCVESTQCRDSLDLEGCSHCDHSRGCVRCTYTSLCFACDDCVQCFACVGLSGEEFCILNERYEKSEYFKTVGRLRAELEKLVADGFLPAFEEDPEAWFDVFDGGAAAVLEAPSRPIDVATSARADAGRADAGRADAVQADAGRADAGRAGSVTRGQRPQREADARPETRTGDGARTGGSSLRTGRRPRRS